MSRAFDIVIYGASGFTGRWVVEEALRSRPRGVRIALAGRNPQRIKDVVLGHSEDMKSLVKQYVSSTQGGGGGNNDEFIQVLACDAKDSSSLERAMSQCRICISCVGPFNLYGMPVVEGNFWRCSLVGNEDC